MERQYELREYQIQAITAIQDAFREGTKRVLRQQPTGTGKSIEIVEVTLRSLERKKSVLIGVPFPHLVDNLERYFLKHGITPGIIQGSRKTDWSAPLKIACIPTLVNRLDQFAEPVDLFLQDEAHHGKSATWERCLKRFDCFKIGYTATPTRLDGRGFADQYDLLIPGKPVEWFIKNNYLAPYRYLTLPHLQFKFEGKLNDNLGRQGEVYTGGEIVGDIVQTWLNECPNQPTLGFAATVEASKLYVAQYNQMSREKWGHDIAIHLDHKTPKRVREWAIAQFGDQIKIIYNVDLFQEGLDLPDCTCLQIVRLTQSLAKCLQMWGRVLRYQAGKLATILDHVGLAEFHGFPNDPREWKLQGWKDLEKLKVYCPSCGNLLIEDISRYSSDQSQCSNCGEITNLIRKTRNGTGAGERGNYSEKKEGELVEIDIRPQQLSIMRILKKRDKQDNKKAWAVYRCLELPYLERQDFAYLCQKLDYKPGYAIQLKFVYDVLWTPNLSQKDFAVRLEKDADRYWQTYCSIHDISDEDNVSDF